jgi:hypothetical protein
MNDPENSDWKKIFTIPVNVLIALASVSALVWFFTEAVFVLIFNFNKRIALISACLTILIIFIILIIPGIYKYKKGVFIKAWHFFISKFKYFFCGLLILLAFLLGNFIGGNTKDQIKSQTKVRLQRHFTPTKTKQKWNGYAKNSHKNIKQKVTESNIILETDNHDDSKTNQNSSHSFHQFEKLEKEYIENYDYVYIGKYVKNIGFIDTRLTAEDGSVVDPENLPKILVTAEGTTTRFKAKLDSPNRKGFQYEYIGFITIDNSMCTLVSDVGSDTSEIWVRFFDIKIKER